MKRLVISWIILLLVIMALSGCVSNRKHQSALRGLMLQENLQLSRNKAFYSKHNTKMLRNAGRKYRKNSRH